jgi:hypothetical protein
MVSPNVTSSELNMASDEGMGGTSESGEEYTDLEDILRMKEETVNTLRSLDGVLAGMFALSEQRNVASEMS